MADLPVSLYDRCRKLLLSECSNEFDSNESVKNIFSGTEIEEYSRYFHDQKTPEDRIDEVIRALKDRRYGGKSVLAKYLEMLAQRSYPEVDDTRVHLIQLAHDIQTWKQDQISHLRPKATVFGSHNAQQATEDEKAKQVLVLWGQNEAAGVEIFSFLSGANLSLVKWSEIEDRMEKNEPSVDEVLRTAFEVVQAIIVVFTSDYLAELKSASANPGISVQEQYLYFHPEPELLFKAGMAFGINQDRTILVTLGNMRFSHTSLERYAIHLTNDDKARERLITKLHRAQCTITGNEWKVRGNFYESDFS